nr:aldose epimerase family protein [Luxibacter massiliensis]
MLAGEANRQPDKEGGENKVEKKEFGRIKDGSMAYLYTLRNKNGMCAAVTDFGAALVSLWVPNEKGEKIDVVLGYDDAAGYEAGEAALGACVGRNANRIGGAVFELNGITYKLEDNDNGNNLHSGSQYYHKRIWTVEEVKDDRIVFLLRSPDNDQGYPGSLAMRASYMLGEENTLRLTYEAVPDKDTIINMTNHSYFNLNGHGSGSIVNHFMKIDADYYTKADAKSIPTGEIAEVEGTPMDFRDGQQIREGIDADYEAIKFGGGYDHNWVLKNNGKFAKVAEAAGDKSGIRMEVWTDMPGMQVYTANFLDHEPGKGGLHYQRRWAVCFETQYFPDAIHHEHFPGPVCRAGKTYKTATEYRFSL